MICLLGTVLGGVVLGTLVNDVFTYILFRFITGVFFAGYILIDFVIIVELFAAKYRMIGDMLAEGTSGWGITLLPLASRRRRYAVLTPPFLLPSSDMGFRRRRSGLGALRVSTMAPFYSWHIRPSLRRLSLHFLLPPGQSALAHHEWPK